MRILCEACGKSSEVVQLSPDYLANDHEAFLHTAKCVYFIYDGEVVDKYILSPDFMNKHGILSTEMPLPDDYPEWVGKVKRECKLCFEKRGQ
jgi:hypothetical protein